MQREVALRGCHNEVGHLSLECMLDLMYDRFFWPHMAAQAKEHISKCHPCLAFKARQPKAPLENIMATHPLELVHLDYLCLEPGKGLDKKVLVVTDHFTRYVQLYVTRTQTAQMTAKTLWNKFIVHYGLPTKILMDQGQNFESQLVADLCKLMAPEPHETDFDGGTRILICWQILDWPASEMHRLACISVCILCSSCIPFYGEVQCKMHFTYNMVCLPSTTCFNIQGNTLNAASEVDYWVGKGVDQGHLAQLQLPYCSK